MNFTQLLVVVAEAVAPRLSHPCKHAIRAFPLLSPPRVGPLAAHHPLTCTNASHRWVTPPAGAHSSRRCSKLHMTPRRQRTLHTSASRTLKGGGSPSTVCQARHHKHQRIIMADGLGIKGHRYLRHMWARCGLFYDNLLMRILE
jgi:hypothetical protein